MVRVIIIVDETGSMMSNKDVTISSYNEFLDSQRESAATEDETEADITSFTLVKFNVNSVLQEVPNVKDAPALTNDTYKPSNCTALYDAMGDTMTKYENEKDNICVIITDGQENASRRFNKNKVFDMIKKYTDDKGWMFQYLGANQDAFAVGGSFGMNVGANKAQTFSANTEGFRSAYNELEEEVHCRRGFQNYKKKMAARPMAVQMSAPAQDFESYQVEKRSEISKVIKSRKK